MNRWSNFQSRQHFTALLSGMLLPLAFAPFSFAALAFVSPGFLWLTVRHCQPKTAFVRGLLFGIGLFGVGASWIYLSVHRYGNANVFLATVITGLFVLILALFIATQLYVFARLAPYYSQRARCLWLFPVLWVIAEVVRTYALTGFPWLFLGYSQIDTVLRGYAPFIGVYGVSLIVVWISQVLFYIATHLTTTKPYLLGLRSKAHWLLLPIFLLCIGALLSTIHFTQPAQTPMTVSLVQGNVAQTLKWDPTRLEMILNRYAEQTQTVWSSQLIVWPEAAIPTLPDNVPDYLRDLSHVAKAHHSTVVFGIPTRNAQQQYFNSLMITGEQNVYGVYHKQRLVPFGEYTPFSAFLSWLMHYWQIPMSDFTKGPSNQPTLYVHHVPFAAFICYEIVYPREALAATLDKQFLLVISDDSWFGASIASPQQLQIAQMRALETNRFLLYATNTGITAIVTPQGQVAAMAPPNQMEILSGNITPMHGNTPLMRFGYGPLWILLLCMLIAPFRHQKAKHSA